MPMFEGKVIEKWSDNPIEGAILEIGDQKVKSNVYGMFRVIAPSGAYEIKVGKRGYEDSIQAMDLFANTKLTIILKPILRAL